MDLNSRPYVRIYVKLARVYPMEAEDDNLLYEN
jgi:hypothetical protein